MPPIFQAVAQAYRDVFHCLRELRTLALIVLLITLAFAVFETLLFPAAVDETSRHVLLRFLSSLALGFLTVPYYIAVHRLLILGERTTVYALTPSNTRFQQFFWWWAALGVVTFVPIFVVQVLPQARTLTPLLLFVTLVLMLAVFLAIIIATLRLTIIFPAVAVDAPGATWENVMADTKGHAWRIFLFGLVASLPFLVPGLVLGVLANTAARSGSIIISALVVLFASILNVFGITLFIAIASRIFLWIGNRVKA